MGGRGGPARNNMSAGILAMKIQGDGWRAALAVHRAMSASIGFIVYSYQSQLDFSFLEHRNADYGNVSEIIYVSNCDGRAKSTRPAVRSE
jgi:hypothetical protein